ncbi:hypothetical protein GWE18_36640 [Bradyrhizobium sp. CSA112]|uniref:hypothetical protein n=1 Tax=Bradyrhizobium sp. CSA112 TaxID=2699170 RepID=UPI0023AFB1AB|nr:hypothetical protein [Bradyrhizobium sp. CSA112]MDE5458242.1 hypothetical protein [Bradyrhizobium sp. CSA112]
MTPTHRIIQESSGIRFSRIASFLYGSAADIAFFITILSVVCFVSGQVVPKTIDTGQQTCIESLAVEGADGSVCHPTQRQDAQALQRLLDTISAEAH